MKSDIKSEVPPPQELDEWFLSLLECPGCDAHRPVKLNERADALICDCGKYAYPVRDGIPILLVEEAEVLDPEADPGKGTAA